MASTSTTSTSSNNSDDSASNKAPDNFEVSNDEDEVSDTLLKRDITKNVRFNTLTGGHNRFGSLGGFYNTNENSLKCPLCSKQQKLYLCRICVKNGNVVHSKYKRTKGESLLEKQQRYLALQRGMKEFSNHCHNFLKQQITNENAQHEMKWQRDKVKFLEELISKKRKNLSILKAEHDKLWHMNGETRKKLPNYALKIKELRELSLDRVEKMAVMRTDNHAVLDRLKEVTRHSIKQLVDYVFPISEVAVIDETRPPSRSPANRNQKQQQLTVPMNAKNAMPVAQHLDADDESETIAALADAKNTSYVRGKWVFHGSGIKEMQYRIVGPSLPANGDYCAYTDWLAENKDDIPRTATNEITPNRVSDCDAFRIIGALTYTTQLTQLLSYFLDVRLPYRLAYGEFCKKLNEKQFLRKVSRLNSNISYLAYTQQVKLSELNENHTLENVLALLDIKKSDLGRYGFHEVSNAPLIRSVDSLLLGIETATESESEDEISFRLDWEDVPNLPTQQEIMNSNLMNPMGQQSTIAESFMMSAAKGISSIFGWRTPRK